MLCFLISNFFLIQFKIFQFLYKGSAKLIRTILILNVLYINQFIYFNLNNSIEKWTINLQPEAML